MAIKTERWDAADVLKSPDDIAAYLDTYLEDGSPEEIRRALNTIARSHGMTMLSKETGLTREALYKALGDKGNPTLETLTAVLSALGMRLSVAPLDLEPAE